MKGNRLLLMPVVAALCFFAFLFFLKRDKEGEILLPLANEREYSDKVNDWLVGGSESKDTDGMPEVDQEKKSKWVRKIANAQSKVFDFSGLVIDQHGNPVPDAVVKYAASGPAESTGVGFVKTNKNGVFNISEARGASLSIDSITKPGYQFSLSESGRGSLFYHYERFPDSLIANKYSSEEPFEYKMWKIDGYPKVKYEKHYSLGFPPNGPVKTIDFLSDKLLQESEADGDIRVLFGRSEEEWSVRFEAVSGGIQETNDQYLNLAPKSGYQPVISYRYDKKKMPQVSKKFYFMTREGKVFGRVEMDVVPYYRDKSAIFMSYVVNLEGGKKLTIR